MVFGYGVSPKERWLTLLAKESGWQVTNGGKNHDTTGGMLERLRAQFAKRTPDVLLVLGGSNDLFAVCPAEGVVRKTGADDCRGERSQKIRDMIPESVPESVREKASAQCHGVSSIEASGVGRNFRDEATEGAIHPIRGEDAKKGILRLRNEAVEEAIQLAARNLSLIIQEGTTRNIPVLLCTILPYCFPFDPPYWNTYVDIPGVLLLRDILNEEIHRLGAVLSENKEGIFLDLDSAFLAIPPEERRALYLDEFHLNEKGHALLTSMILPHLG